MVIKSAELKNVVGVTTRKLPDTGLPEIAFAGRSNVGKSSLINALLQRKSLARTSSTPGKTQTMNYYKVNDDVFFVDLPVRSGLTKFALHNAQAILYNYRINYVKSMYDVFILASVARAEQSTFI